MKKLFFAVTSVFALLVTACTREDADAVKSIDSNGEIASLTISLKGQSTIPGRAVGESSTTTNPAVEGVISNMTVFVFNAANSALEKQATFDLSTGTYTHTITGLSTATTKRIVAYVNVPTGVSFSSVTTYSDLNANSITLASQYASDINDVGLFMSGSATDVTLSTTSTNEVTIPVSRLVSKVFIKSLKISPDANSSIDLFEIGGAAIQLARWAAVPVEGNIFYDGGTESAEYVGGLSTTSFPNVLTGLKETITYDFTNYTSGMDLIESVDDEIYFYVMPNDTTDGIGTMITLYGTYGTSTIDAYYPLVFNSGVIAANQKYALSITLKNLHIASEDPTVMPEEAALEVTVDPQDWENTISQDLEW